MSFRSDPRQPRVRLAGERYALRDSAAFRWVLRILALGGLVALAYQLTNGTLCVLHRSGLVCPAGPRSYAIALAFAFFCLAIGASTFRRGAALARACGYLGAVFALLAVGLGALGT